MYDYQVRFQWPGSPDRDEFVIRASNDAEALLKAAMGAINVLMIVWQGDRYVGEIAPIDRSRAHSV